jgi:hypothetical protein
LGVLHGVIAAVFGEQNVLAGVLDSLGYVIEEIEGILQILEFSKAGHELRVGDTQQVLEFKGRQERRALVPRCDASVPSGKKIIIIQTDKLPQHLLCALLAVQNQGLAVVFGIIRWANNERLGQVLAIILLFPSEHNSLGCVRVFRRIADASPYRH